MWHPEGPQGYESRKIRHLIPPYTIGKGLDVGCGTEPAWPHMLGVDSGKQYGGARVSAVQSDGTRLSQFSGGSQDFVFSSHFLEHVTDTGACLREWWRVIKPGGHLVLYLPHADLYPRIGMPGGNPDHKRDLRPDDVIEEMRAVGGWDLIENEVRDGGDGREPFSEYSFFQVFRKRDDHEQNVVPWRKPEKSCLVVRYGGYGDQVMASAILPGLKDQGYHVTYNTTPKGQQVLLHDPHVDAWWLQDEDQVPNEGLGEYWRRLSERFDRVINLCESIEGDMLFLPGRPKYHWPDGARRRVVGTRNYLDQTMAVADVDGPPRPAFYATEEEQAWARETAAQVPGPVLLWVLTGSSVHKRYPHVDAAAVRLLNETDLSIVFCGDDKSKRIQDAVIDLLARYGIGAGRVMCAANQWSIRQSMAFAKHGADVVLGPETGVLNAVGLEDIPKVVMLSHSHPGNLVTPYWKQTAMLVAHVPCWPCHRMHYDWSNCHRDAETGAAICAAKIGPEHVVEAVKGILAHERAEEAPAEPMEVVWTDPEPKTDWGPPEDDGDVTVLPGAADAAD